VGDQFAFEITHFIFGRNALGADAPGPAPVAGPAENIADQQPQEPLQEQQPPVDAEPQPEEQPEQQQPQLQPQPQPEPQPQQADREREREQEQEQQQGQGQGQGQEQAQAPPQEQQQQQPEQQLDDNDFGAVAARAIRVTGASLGRLIGGALAMPTIARVMGAVLLRLSHVVPLIRAIIAPRPHLRLLPPPPPPSAFAAVVNGLVGIWGGRTDSGLRVYGGAGAAGVGGGLGAKVFGGFLATSQEWAMSDPVWYDAFLFLFLFF
jgi:hypothetical protein